MSEAEKRLYECLENVKDRATFIEFVEALIEDREDTVAREKLAPENHRGYGAFGWQNDSIEAYFGAALSCVEDNAERNPVLSEKPSWKSFADFLYCGKIYE